MQERTKQNFVVSLVLPEQGGADLKGSANDVTGRFVAFALVVALVIPLQAAGEEFAFRGYLTQTVGGLFRGRIGSALAPALRIEKNSASQSTVSAKQTA